MSRLTHIKLDNFTSFAGLDQTFSAGVKEALIKSIFAPRWQPNPLVVLMSKFCNTI